MLSDDLVVPAPEGGGQLPAAQGQATQHGQHERQVNDTSPPDVKGHRLLEDADGQPGGECPPEVHHSGEQRGSQCSAAQPQARRCETCTPARLMGSLPIARQSGQKTSQPPPPTPTTPCTHPR